MSRARRRRIYDGVSVAQAAQAAGIKPGQLVRLYARNLAPKPVEVHRMFLGYRYEDLSEVVRAVHVALARMESRPDPRPHDPRPHDPRPHDPRPHVVVRPDLSGWDEVARRYSL